MIGAALLGLGAGLAAGVAMRTPSVPEVSVSTALDRAAASSKEGRAVKIVDASDRVTVHIDGAPVVTAARRMETDIPELLRDRGAAVSVELEQQPLGMRIESALSLGFMLLFIGVISYALFSGRLTGSGGLGRWLRSGASSHIPTDRFTNVAGMEHVKRELSDVVTFLKDPARFDRLGARVPRGVLLSGPPGTGKTLLARAVAGEAGVPYYSISGSGFVEMFVGVGAARVRDLFKEARKNEPAIIFVDELDAVGRQRGSEAIADSETERALNQILVEMDGFSTSGRIIVIGATNRPDLLDKALLRPGRFDRRVGLDLPDQAGRRAILNVHVSGKPLADDVDLDGIARDTWQFSGADLANLVNEAAIEAARDDSKAIDAGDFEVAYERALIGVLREGTSSREERERVATHELGHAIVALRLAPAVDPVHKISIISRGVAGGYTRLRPEQEDRLRSRSKLIATLAFMLGGYVAETLHYQGDSSTGPVDDIKRANELAWEMVCRYGMDREIGPTVIDRETWTANEARTVSDRTRALVDERVRALLDEAEKVAHQQLEPLMGRFGTLVETLLEEETMDGERLAEILADA